ncbi:PhaM family polyhydroxyalkanoate granule multifunctional regulatory protein [uncultured Ramlibacter sp.]|uniref:PhaM family polyhydroxyalkanoate granule multifunctional regulatory protein n=1 Tax=uncultured Ramlibacter sp. TaxID=260755 RepID=UPI00260B7C5B|nr:PhaM family polyhydroxyalkanoate granule multifunctional regulatory protein [uncultured Ramlibacter sp.]
MSDNENFGFGKFVPGFDFLQNIAKGASQTLPQMPNLSHWVAPTLNVEELDKRIEELKAVHFWLDQNGKALGATIQALEVQKMTLATLKGMNFSMADVANALKLKAGEKPAAKASTKTAAGDGQAGSVVDPLQWWGALTQQFQEIAAGALKDVAGKTPVDTAKHVATGVAKEAVKAPKRGVAVAARKTPAKKAARKP